MVRSWIRRATVQCSFSRTEATFGEAFAGNYVFTVLVLVHEIISF